MLAKEAAEKQLAFSWAQLSALSQVQALLPSGGQILRSSMHRQKLQQGSWEASGSNQEMIVQRGGERETPESSFRNPAQILPQWELNLVIMSPVWTCRNDWQLSLSESSWREMIAVWPRMQGTWVRAGHKVSAAKDQIPQTGCKSPASDRVLYSHPLIGVTLTQVSCHPE